MGKINDALEKRSKEYHQNLVETAMVSSSLSKEPAPVKSAIRSDMAGYEDILTRLSTRYPEESIKSIMFTSANHGGGSTTTSVNFAKTLVSDSEVKVLLIDANLRTPNLKKLFGVTEDRGLSDLIFDNDYSAFKVIKFGNSFLYVLACGGNYTGPVSLFESKRFDAFMEKANSWFDYVILDAAPLPYFAESRILCEKVDGVILVIESAKIRKQVALRARKELEDAGARILGVVINKRKYHIPEWIYKRL